MTYWLIRVLQEGKPLVLKVVREAERRVVEDPKQDKVRPHAPLLPLPMPACLPTPAANCLHPRPACVAPLSAARLPARLPMSAWPVIQLSACVCVRAA